LIPELELHHTSEKDLEALQGNLKKFVKPLEDNPTLSGRYIEDVVLVDAAVTEIEHKLDRVPRGWILCDIEGDLLWSYGRTAWDEKTISIGCNTLGGTDVTVKIWVF
jgi:hypothetical protein